MAEWYPYGPTYITYPADGTLGPRAMALLSLYPPFGVCALLVATIIYKDVIASYLLIGSLVSAVISTILKRIIQEPRPERYDDDGHIDFGMPSTHSCFAWFSCTFVILCILCRGGIIRAACDRISNTTNSLLKENRSWLYLTKLWNFLHTSFTVILAIFLAIGVSYSRVYLGYHTLEQIYAGSVLGIALAIFWHYLFLTKLVQNLLSMVDTTITELERQRKSIYCNQDKKQD